MATENSRDIELRIAATTSGSEQVKKLANELDQLSKEGSEATPEFKRLADELDKVAQQGDAVAALNAVEQQVSQTSAAFSDARTKVEALQVALNEQRQTTESFRSAQVAAQQAVDATAARLREQEGALKLLRAEYQGAQRNTDEYRAKNRELQRSIAELENALADQKAALKSANSDLRENESALSKAESAYNKASTAAQRLEKTLAGQSSELTKARSELDRLGVSAETSAQAQQQVEIALTNLRQQTRQAQTAIEGYNLVVAEAAREEREWAQQKAAAEKAAEYRKLQEARNYVEFWTKALNDAEAAERAAADQARRTAAAQKVLNDAFGVTGVRSAEAIKAEIDQIAQAMVTLRNNSSVTATEFNRAFASAQGRLNALQSELSGTPEVVNRTGAALGAVKSAFSQLIAIYGVFELSQKFLQANIALETLRRSLTLVTGSTEAANRQIQLLQETANRAGVSIGEISTAFTKFQASLNGANIPLETTEGLFRAVINASGQLGLSSQRTSLILEALAQTASKGVVSMEELRQQLGDSLPGALSLTARGLGISTAELVKLTETGRLLAEDFLPALRKALVDTYGDGQREVEGLQQAWNRFKNALTETSQLVGEGGVTGILSRSLDSISGKIKELTSTWNLFSTAVSQVSANTQFDLSRPIESLRSFGAAVDGEIGKLLDPKVTEGITRFRDGLLSFDFSNPRASLRALSQTVNETNKAYKESADRYINAAKESASLEAETQRLLSAQAVLATTTNSLASGWVGLETAYVKVREEVEKNIAASTKLAEAKKIEGEASIAIANLSGNEQQVLLATAEAARQNAEALQNVATLRKADADIIRAQIDALRIEAERLGDVSGARRQAIEELQKNLDLRTADAAKAREAAEAASLEATAQNIAVQSYRDNSAALIQLRDARNAANTALKLTIELEKQGKATKDDVRDASVRAAQAEALYRDAVKDSAVAIERKRQAVATSLSVQEAKLRLDQQEIETSIAYARQRGDEQAVVELTIRQKRIEIEIIEAKRKALLEEVRLEQIKLEIERAALDQADPLYRQKKAELDIRIQLLEVKRLEAAASEQQVERIELEIRALREKANESSKTADGFVNDRDREIESLDRLASASDRAADAERRRRRVDAEGFSTDNQGNRIGAAGETWLSLYNQAKSAGLDDAAAKSLAGEFTDSQGNVQFFDNPGQLRYGGRGSTLSQAFSNAIAQAIRNRPNQQGQGGQQGALAGQQGVQQAIRVDINLNGQRTSVNVASQSDATALQNLLLQLQQAAQRSGG